MPKMETKDQKKVSRRNMGRDQICSSFGKTDTVGQVCLLIEKSGNILENYSFTE
jgi:hypothetical protein